MRVTYPSRSREELLAELRQKATSLSAELPVCRVILFGSWASGRATASSDIDLLVIYEGSRRNDAYKLIRRHFRIRGLEPHVYAEEDAEAMREVLDRMIKDGIQVA